MSSPLVLKEYFFPVFQVVALPKFSADRDVSDLEYSVDVGLLKAEKGNEYQLSVEIRTADFEKSDENQPSYDINLVALGIFEVNPKWPEPEKLVKINGASILYSAAREFLITITSRGPWGAVTLPTVSFNREFGKKDKEKKILD